MPRSRRFASLVVMTVALGGCQLPSYGLPHAATKQADNTFTLWQGLVTAALVVGVIVWALIFWSVIKYRRRDNEIPPQTLYNIPAEIVYTVLPVIAVVVIFLFAVRAEHRVDHQVADPAVKIEVLGFQWQWQFSYPADHIQVTGASTGPYPQLVVPAGQTVQLHLVAADVVHSFWVPQFLFKRDLIPGIDNTIQFTVKQPGSYVGRCAAFCGLDHSHMDFTVRALTPDDYQRWVFEHRGQHLDPTQEGLPG